MGAVDERKAVVESYFQCVDANDFDRLVHLFTVDTVYERPGYEPILGREALRSFYAQDRVIASGQHHIDQVVVEGDWACAWGSFSGRSRSGAELREKWCDVYRFLGAEICHRRTHFFRAAV